MSELISEVYFQNEYKEFAIRMVEIQEMLGFSDEMMASLFGITEEYYIKRIKTGKYPLTQDKVFTLKAKGFDLCYLYYGRLNSALAYRNINRIPELEHELIIELTEVPEDNRKLRISNLVNELIKIL